MLLVILLAQLPCSRTPPRAQLARVVGAVLVWNCASRWALMDRIWTDLRTASALHWHDLVLYWCYTGTIPLLQWYDIGTACASTTLVLHRYGTSTALALYWGNICPAVAL